MPGIVQGTEYTIMNKTGLFPVLLRLNLEKKNRPKKKLTESSPKKSY